MTKDAATPTFGFGRIPITGVSPVISCGTYPVKCVVNELVPVQANVFREGHDAVNACVVLTSPEGAETRYPMHQVEPAGLDIWQSAVRPDAEGEWTFTIEAYSDPWRTYHHNACAKLAAEIDKALVVAEGHQLFKNAIQIAKAAEDRHAVKVLRGAQELLDVESSWQDLLHILNTAALDEAMTTYGPRDLVTATPAYPIRVERRRALFSSWYEFFPRSQGATFDETTGKWTSGTFDDCHERLEAAAKMGFDVVYLPPIHPIGSAFRKGKNNTLDHDPDDPGSPWAIGNVDGGHDAIHPELGDFEAFDRFVKKAHSLGIEVALDFALQASPDHPWVKKHPEWFTTRVDGTIAYAENPPKKYQDIYPLNFDNDPEGIYAECLRVLKFWIKRGVTIFRVDNPHTKPLNFWQWLLDQVYQTNPEVLFLAEAFTRPQMMHALGKVGFQQSYTYFTWRNRKWEIEEYMRELSRETADFYRPNFFVNTPDINPTFLQSGNPNAFAIRAILAATLSPSWGVYSGFELCEHVPLKPGGEEYLDSEKYEFRPRDFNQEPNLNVLLGRLNEIRRAHPALQQLRNINFHHAPHDEVIVFSKLEQDDLVIVVCSLNADATVDSEIYLDYGALMRPAGSVLQVHDELTGQDFTWGGSNYVRLWPGQPAHILHVL